MAWKDEPKNLIVDFLNKNITDPRGRLSAVTDTFNGTGASQTLTLTPTAGKKVRSINSVTSNAVTKSKWQDYTFDIQNNTVTGTFDSGTGNVVVTYNEGTTGWIFPDLAKVTLTSTSYPRINVLLVSSKAERMGNYTADLQSTEHYQADIWVKENYYYNDGTIVHEGDALAMYLARQMIKAFEDNINELYPYLQHFTHLNTRDAVWETERQCFHVIVEFELSGISIGG